MVERGSWNRTQRRYGTRQRRSAIGRVLALSVATIVVVTAFAILTSAHIGGTTVTAAPSATPSIALASGGRTIAAAARPQPALPTTAPRARSTPPVSRGRIARSRATIAVRVAPSPRVRRALVGQVRAFARRRRSHGPSTPAHVANSAVVITAGAPPTPSAPRAPRLRPAVRSEPPSNVATYVQPAPPVPRPAQPTTPPCYPGQLNC